MISSDIFIGPLLRRAQSDLIVICISTFQPIALKFSVRLFGKDEWIGHDEYPINLSVFSNLHFYFAQITPLKGENFPTNQLLEYSIGLINPNTNEVDYSFFEKIVKDDMLSYKNAKLPTFYLQELPTKLNAVYGSCRKIHDVNGGKVDALSYADDLIDKTFFNLTARPGILCLGGDQIYADDVHALVLEEITNLAIKLTDNKTETLPASLTLPSIGNRKNFVTNYAKFTSDESDNHLITLPEYLGMYGLMWNKNNWSKEYSELSHFTNTLQKVRRLLANIPTYMIFDDHDVTDDWNLCVKWQNDVYRSKLGKRIVANAIAAFWLCQGYGNDPDKFSKDIVFQISDIIKNKDNDHDTFENLFWSLDNWEFFTPTFPIIYFLNTRTKRGLKDGYLGNDTNAPAYLKSVDSWIVTIKTLTTILKKQNRDFPLIIVSPAPVFGFKFIEDLQNNVVSPIAGPYFLDQECWAANKKHLLLFLRIMGNMNVVLLSGDVHYGYTSTVKFSVFDNNALRTEIRQFPSYISPPPVPSYLTPTYNFLWSAKFIQLTSSALKNFASDTFTKIPADLTTIEPSLFIDEDGNTFKGKYENGNFYEWKKPNELSEPEFVLSDKQIIKPSSLFRQRINDPYNSKYIGEHNIGQLIVNRQEVTNCFYTINGKESERTWNFQNDRYWS